MESGTAAAPAPRRARSARRDDRRGVPASPPSDHADRVAVRTKDDEVALTWGELRERVDALAGGLREARRAPRRHASR